ncbi:DUF456 domain-containing protein [Coralloluteibacterium stylophorae]|uniref:DUF456 domain-containing protein n=1 Tax=Coralloluteibacterium stylophorae TaxID=1776034 RepID=A0A8J7VRY2_9GAMM|nr:DUF456 domain-containing protein [Coralloluteibacterium stylophorae]MBS7455845.1 DUF456 domain-containing protein [Coralloluteibacterium stylophorae]
MSFDPTLLLYVLGALLVVVGIAGLILPALPGPPLVFGGMLVAAWAEDFERVGAVTLIVLAVMAALAYLIDFAAGVLGARRYGASTLALWGSAIGTVVGLFFGLPGLILGPFAGAAVGELIHSRRIGLASQVGMATWLGIVVGAIAKIALSFVMIGVFVFALIV